ncbi:MAG TPA: DUF4142 domain-containing protein [Planctomicrobium sp.]|nr:DUF4142 domain-containing protein [Planctomicrobium sp.]
MLKDVSFHALALAMLAGVATAAEPVQAPREVNQEKTQIQVQPGTRQPGVQQPGVQIEKRRDHVDSNRQATSSLEQHVANCLALQNQEEINLARFAMERTQNPKVKEFAEMMIRDHEALNQRLQPFGNHRETASAETRTFSTENERLPVTTPAERREARQELREQGVAPRDAREIVRDGTQQGGAVITGQQPAVQHRTGFRGDQADLGDRLYQIAKEAHKNCEQMTRDELSKENGADFDKAYLGSQIGAHIGMLAHLKACQSQVSGELQQVLKDATQTAEQHKQHAEQLKKELKTASNQRQ